jgi:16S rRNA (guanine527-N7)-methyltransferase
MNYNQDDFIRDTRVSRETSERLETHRRLLEIWSKRINLIGPRELEHYWRRHALDSAQLVSLEPEALRWVDLGSGAGFPGLVVACLLAERDGAHVDLVEISPKRVAFLREAVRETGAPARVLELDVAALGAREDSYEVVCARAFAPLPRIMNSAKAILDRGARGLFLKGADYRAELAASAEAGWKLKVDLAPSASDPEGRILRIEGAERVS